MAIASCSRAETAETRQNALQIGEFSHKLCAILFRVVVEP